MTPSPTAPQQGKQQSTLSDPDYGALVAMRDEANAAYEANPTRENWHAWYLLDRTVSTEHNNRVDARFAAVKAGKS